MIPAGSRKAIFLRKIAFSLRGGGCGCLLAETPSRPAGGNGGSSVRLDPKNPTFGPQRVHFIGESLLYKPHLPAAGAIRHSSAETETAADFAPPTTESTQSSIGSAPLPLFPGGSTPSPSRGSRGPWSCKLRSHSCFSSHSPQNQGGGKFGGIFFESKGKRIIFAKNSRNRTRPKTGRPQAKRSVQRTDPKKDDRLD